MSSVGDLSLTTPNNTWELNVLSGFAISDTGSYDTIATDNNKNKKRITTSFQPVNWNFQTYIRPTGASVQHYANSTVNNTTVDGNARPVADWFMWQALMSNVSISEKSAWHHNLSTGNVSEGLSASSSTSEFKAAQENYLYIKADNLWYKVGNAVVNSAVLDATISELATVTWSGFGTDIIEIPSGNISYQPFSTMNVAGSTSVNSFINNRLSTIDFTVNSNSYSFPVTALNFNYKNGISYLSRKQVSGVSVPVGQYTDSRDITGSATMYLRDATFVNELRSTVSANATIKIGNDMKISMASVHFKVPSISVGDAFTFTADFLSEGLTEIEFLNAYSAADLTLDFENDIYFSANKRVGNLVYSGRGGLKNAWMPDGTIGWAGHNLLANSEDFGKNTWNGFTANILIESTSNSSHSGNTNTVVSTGGYTATIEAKPNGRDWIFLNVSNSGAYFNILNGTIGNVSVGYTATIEPKSDSFYKCSITGSGGTYTVNLAASDNVISYAGDGVSGAYLRKASMYRSDYGGMQGVDYYKSGDTSYHAPAVSYSNGIREGIVVEPSITRLNLYPICNASWRTSGAVATYTNVNALGVFPGVEVASTGATWNGLEDRNFATVTSGVTYYISVLYALGTSGDLKILIHDPVANTYSIVYLNTTATNGSGVISNIIVNNGILSFEFTPNFTGAMWFRISPNSVIAGETVEAYGAFIYTDFLPNTPALVGGNADYLQIGRELASTEYVSSLRDRTNWDIGPNTIIEGRVATSSNTAANTRIIGQSLATDSLKYYNISIEASANTYFDVYNSSGSLLTQLVSGSSSTFKALDSYIDIKSSNSFTGQINSVSVKEWVPFTSFDSSKGTFVLNSKIENDNVYVLASTANSYFVAKNSNITAYANSNIVSSTVGTGYFRATTMYGSNITIQVDSATMDSASMTDHMAPTNGILQLGNLANSYNAKGVIKKLEYFK